MEEFDVNVSDPEVKDEYGIYLYSEDRCFRIEVNGNDLQAMAVHPIEWASEPKVVNEEVVVESPKGVLTSPLKDLTNLEETRVSPRKKIPGRFCRPDLSDKENLDPQTFSKYPVRTHGPKKEPLALNRDGFYTRNPTAKKLHYL